MVVILIFLSANAYAKSEIYTAFLSSKAIGGYDAVAYFTENKPVEGMKQFKTEYKGANWYFSSSENLAKFKQQPEKFAPQYGGYCAWAVGNGYTAKGDPLHWTIHKNRLYLNYNEDIKNQWLANIDSFISSGDANWPGVIE